ncbi:MAG: penicillin-binding protein 1C [Gammaproteobacteria bacterium]
MAYRLHNAKFIDSEPDSVLAQALSAPNEDAQFNTRHLIQYASRRAHNRLPDAQILGTTLDGELQRATQQILDTRLTGMAARNVTNGAVLIVDHETNEIPSWVVGFAGIPDHASNQLDTVLARRQPGSSLKPLL